MIQKCSPYQKYLVYHYTKAILEVLFLEDSK